MTAKWPRWAVPGWLHTVRAKLTLLAMLLVVVVMTGTAVVVVTFHERLVIQVIDDSLQQRAHDVRHDAATLSFEGTLPTRGDAEDTFLQVLARDGHVLAATSNASRLRAVTPPLPATAHTDFRTVSDVPLSDHEFRVLRRRVGFGPDATTLVVAKNLDDFSESFRILKTLLGTTIPVITLLLGLLVWWLTGRALRPVESLRAEVADIQGTELHRRVPVPRTHDEISRLARTMNGLLDRVERATDRQRRFVADASHELRGPVTRMRSSLEVAAAHPAGTEPEALYPSLLDDTVDLQRLVDDLLFLARSDAGGFDRPSEVLDLDDLVLAEAGRMRRGGSVRVDTSAVSAARTVGERRQLAVAIRNLAANAARFARSTVGFELREVDGECELVVTDDGPGVPPEQRTAVFKRFARLDEARTPDAGGAGLGLAIVEDVVLRHGGRVFIEDSDGPGARFVVRLPSVE